MAFQYMEFYDFFERATTDISRCWTKFDPASISKYINPLQFLSSQSWHEVEWVGHWDYKRIFSEYKEALVYSFSRNEAFDPKGRSQLLETAIFKLGEGLFFGMQYINHGPNHMGIPLRVWASGRDLAASTTEDLRARFLMREKRTRKRPRFNILSVGCIGVERTSIEISEPLIRSNRELGLHYGDDFPDWYARFIQILRMKKSGVSILRGDPGTGKTSFIRHLVSKLTATHRFYYLPVRHYRMLADPEMANFWIQENKEAGFENIKKVVILEDAESLVIERGSDNHDDLANLLNISDGLLGEFLQVQVICTINCALDKLDPAVTRPGRLLGFRNFRRLTRCEAEALASAKRLKLQPQDDYSLAEIYNSSALPKSPPIGARSVGFAAV